jgi:hypothetical protein
MVLSGAEHKNIRNRTLTGECDHPPSDGGSNGRVVQFAMLATVIRRMTTSHEGASRAPRQITIEITGNVCHPLL